MALPPLDSDLASVMSDLRPDIRALNCTTI